MLRPDLCEGNMFKYLREYGEMSFNELKFDEVDGLILAQFSYLKLGGLIPRLKDQKDSVVLSRILLDKNWKRMFRNDKYAEENRELFRLMMKSKRFGRMRLNYHVDYVDIHKEVQFSATTFFLENGPVCIAFRGTDENIIGWKENLNMALKDPVPAQIFAATYVNRVADLITEPLILCGHSKGGNLAVFAGCKCRRPVGERIEMVFNYDGPGFCAGFIDNEAYKRVVPKVRKFVTQESVVGYLLWSSEESVLVDNCERGINQHCVYGWKTRDNHFAILKADSTVRKEIEEWNVKLSTMQEKERKRAVDAVYSLLKMSDEERIQNAVNFLEAVKSIDRETAKMLLEAVFLIKSAG